VTVEGAGADMIRSDQIRSGCLLGQVVVESNERYGGPTRSRYCDLYVRNKNQGLASDGSRWYIAMGEVFLLYV